MNFCDDYHIKSFNHPPFSSLKQHCYVFLLAMLIFQGDSSPCSACRYGASKPSGSTNEIRNYSGPETAMNLRGGGFPIRQYFDSREIGTSSIYICNTCGAQLFLSNEIISKSFQAGCRRPPALPQPRQRTRPTPQGRSGRAYLVRRLRNACVGPSEDRVLVSGLHAVADITCRVCQVAAPPVATHGQYND